MSSGGIVQSSNQGSTQQQQQGVGRRSKLIERLLEASANLPAFMQDLLQTMAVTVAGTEAAGFLLEQGPEGQNGLRLVTHIRPDESDDDVRAAAIKAFQEIIVPCIQQNKDGAIEVGTPDDGEPQFCLVTLLRNEGATVAVAAVITRCRDAERARQRLMSMQLVAGYFELYMMRRQMEQARELAIRHQNVLQLTTSVATADGFEAAAMGFCNELANRGGASRVSLGWVKGEHVKVRAMSHTEKFDKKQDLVVRLQRVMDECLDQEEAVRFDADGTRSDNVTRESEALCRSQGDSAVYSVPLRRRDEIVGVVTLEYTPPDKLTDEVANALAVTADLLAPQLWDRHENDRWLAVKAGKSLAHATKLAIGPKHILAKLIIALVIGLGFFLALFTPMYHVSAPFQFVYEKKLTISAPFEGQLESISVVAGNHFKKGQLLFKMRTEPIVLKLRQAEADYAIAKQNYQAALADTSDPAAAAKAEGFKYEMIKQQVLIDLAKWELSQAEYRAPFDGMVLRPELNDRVGTILKEGETLMEIVEDGEPLVAELQVPERDIHYIRQMPSDWKTSTDTVGWTGGLATNALPSHEIQGYITRIVPAGEANQREADNTFKVYVRLKDQPGFAQSGMAGEARIDAGKRSLAWIWTHRLIEWARLKLWW